MEAKYNDVGQWRYKDLVAAFGAKEGTYKTYQVKTKQEVHDLLQDEDFASGKSLKVRRPDLNQTTLQWLILEVCKFVELYMPKEDAPIALQRTAEASAKNNAKQE